MEPRQTSHEQVPPLHTEQMAPGEFPLPALEQEGGRSHERVEARPSQIETDQQISQVIPSILPTPVAQSTQTDDTKPSDDTPIAAADEDLIEKEWVDKAKQIISTTKDDPYRREQEIKRLQLDYVQKRYGKSIGAKED